jgi:hypothetical protein
MVGVVDVAVEVEPVVEVESVGVVKSPVEVELAIEAVVPVVPVGAAPVGVLVVDAAMLVVVSDVQAERNIIPPITPARNSNRGALFMTSTSGTCARRKRARLACERVLRYSSLAQGSPAYGLRDHGRRAGAAGRRASLPGPAVGRSASTH